MKGQGIAINTIVIIAVAVLVLVLIVGFVTGWFGKTIPGFSKPIKTIDLQSARAECQQLLADLQVQASNIGINAKKYDKELRRFDYFKKTFTIDLNKDGKIDEDEKDLHCWNPPISVYATIEFANGVTCYLNDADKKDIREAWECSGTT